jgi:hypothetical protein
VGAITEGRIAKVLANPGDFVKTGQVIARMHSHDIHESRAQYRKAVNELARLKNVAEYSQRVRERARRLYELKAGWRFVSRQIELTPQVAGTFRVNAVTAMRAKVVESVQQTYQATGSTGTVFLRFPTSGSDPGTGLMLVQQNDFLSWSMSLGTFSMSYSPDMDWSDTYGPYLADRVCIGLYQMIGYKYPASMVGEWACRGAFLQLDEHLKSAGVNEADFYPAAWKEAVFQDHVYAIPYNIDGRALYYNKALLKEAGFVDEKGNAKAPRDWDELEKYAIALTKRDQHGRITQLGFAPNYGNSWLFLYAWLNGGEFVSPNGKSTRFMELAAVNGLRAYFSLGRFLPPRCAASTAWNRTRSS